MYPDNKKEKKKKPEDRASEGNTKCFPLFKVYYDHLFFLADIKEVNK